MEYTVETTEDFDREFRRHGGKKGQLESIKAKLSQYPDKYGKPLSGRLHGIWQERMGPFRVWYVIGASGKRVVLIAFKHKGEAVKLY